MNQNQMKQRTRMLALRVFRLVDVLPSTMTSQVIAKQLLRSATSVGANYRAACRTNSPRAMAAKLNIVLEEADETLFWLELITDARIVKAERLSDLIDETNQITAMIVASLKTLRRNNYGSSQSR